MMACGKGGWRAPKPHPSRPDCQGCSLGARIAFAFILFFSACFPAPGYPVERTSRIRRKSLPVDANCKERRYCTGVAFRWPRLCVASTVGGGRKGKENKHTKTELKNKEKTATQNVGGGKDGLKDRKGGEAGHAKFECKLCGVRSPSLTTQRIHHEAKHPTIPFEPDKLSENVHQKFGGTTKGVAVKGAHKFSKKRKKEKKKQVAGAS
mmetsp:Transcript_24935/g.59968  ORF Transcript_24935/g.59968 Transcript_24935/m.59968 type:complete len:208 (+) Transcript_24935:76-699(+)